MPELPEVETVRRGLEPVLQGRTIAGVLIRRRDLRRPVPELLAERLAGRVVETVGRRAKYLLIGLDRGETLVVHLGMSGRFRISATRPEPERHDHMILEIAGGPWVIYNDSRRFGLVDLVTSQDLSRHPDFAGLGPEPLDPAFDGPALQSRLALRRGPLKGALLDQRTVAGLGNIYVCESLFRARLSPLRPAGGLGREAAGRLARNIREVLAEAIEAGGSSLRDHARPDGGIGYFQLSLAVYGREGEPCPGCTCREGIRRIVQGGRSTFYCARRQR